MATFQTKMMGKNSQFEVRYSAQEPEVLIATIEPKGNRQIKDALQKYYNLLTISTKKYNDLVSLCTKLAIPRHLWDEYLKLPHSSTVPDTLAAPDEEETDT